MKKHIRILMAKTSLDGHWRGVVVVTTALRDAGMEVIYGGMITPQQIVESAVQEGVDVIGLNVGGSLGTIRDILELIREQGIFNEVLVVAGGTIAPEDIPLLKEWGVVEVFPPGSSLESIVTYIRQNVKRR